MNKRARSMAAPSLKGANGAIIPCVEQDLRALQHLVPLRGFASRCMLAHGRFSACIRDATTARIAD